MGSTQKMASHTSAKPFPDHIGHVVEGESMILINSYLAYGIVAAGVEADKAFMVSAEEEIR